MTLTSVNHWSILINLERSTGIFGNYIIREERPICCIFGQTHPNRRRLTGLPETCCSCISVSYSTSLLRPISSLPLVVGVWACWAVLVAWEVIEETELKLAQLWAA